MRIVSATHQDLARCVEQGRFRQDLFYRLNVIELSLPPLRERLDDLPVLTDAILARLSAAGGQRATLGPGVLDALRGYSFPGNVRELENVLERALAFSNDGVIDVGDLALKGARLAEGPAAVSAPATGSAPAAGFAPAPGAAPAAPVFWGFIQKKVCDTGCPKPGCTVCQPTREPVSNTFSCGKGVRHQAPSPAAGNDPMPNRQPRQYFC